ncbi:DNA polymerase I [Butyricicoccus faecihominis]|uniref:DNA polymerase I n=1 Tax=Butyricicoccus faecihominis TaxID=1712515 RepID=UPI002479ACC9|nr:DNA polymerase I [Butyricicoccus faecihominis]MCQ5128860.1 DNA polymerase I [Butyricicoccus faecihominis]
MKIMVIDGNSILNRAFYGIRQLSNHEGLPTNGIYGFLSTLFKLQEDEKPDRTVVCFDVREKTFRHQKFESYKATRKGMPDELAAQLPVLKEVLDAMGLTRAEQPGFEADDLIGTISRLADENGDDCVIVTGDKDSLQLVGGGTVVSLVSTRMGQTTYERYDTAKFHEKYGFDPIRLIDLKALMGDSSDNISGVPGVGEKTAMQLMHDFGSLEAIYAHLDDPKIKKSVKTKLEAGEQAAKDSYWLATIDRQAPLSLDVKHLPEEFMDEEALYALLTRLEFKNFIARLGLSGETAKFGLPEVAAEELTRASEAFALCDALGAEEDPVFAVIAGSLSSFCLLAGDTAHVLFEQQFEPEDWDALTDRLFDGSISLVLHDAKPVCHALMRMGKEPKGIAFDTCLAAYLLDPTQGSYDLPRVALAYCNTELPEIDWEAGPSLLGDTEEALRSMAAHANAVRAIYQEAEAKLEEWGMHALYFDIELPLMHVLAEMEALGCAVAPDQLRAFGQTLDKRIAELVDEIYKDAGGEFNINSPRQLGEILFERLGLPAQKKTKTGYSTNVEVLEGLAEQHPIVGRILEYRQLSKLKSTYVDGLLKVISPEDGRIHSHFQQTVTATGRLSSTDPNLQNIPVRTELGRELRRMFVAGDREHVLIDADYSQIELRVLAHISQDEAMTEAFLHGQDIHTATASKVYHVPIEDVTPQMRSSCKAVNFGIVYGISDFSLAQDIGVSRKQAGEFIRSYLATYPGVAKYMEEIKESAREKGYVETLFGRRRALPELKSKNFNIRSFGERVAMNTPIQGTAADIIKIAMVRVHDRLLREGLKSRLILQVHDELILEAPVEERDTAMRLLREEMEGAFQMTAPLVAEAKAGFSWYDAK